MKKFDNYRVSLNKNSYEIYIGRDLLKSLNKFIPKKNKYTKIIVVTDKIISKIDKTKNTSNLSSAIRLYVLNHLKGQL